MTDREEGFREGIEAAAKVADTFKGGYSINTDGELTTDPDGPWALNTQFAAAIRALLPPDSDSVRVSVSALKWLMGCGDDFERPENAKGNYWWRSEFCKRAGISGETVNEWAMLAAQERREE